MKLFSAGTSRGGTTFFARILSSSSNVKVASDPFLPIFKHYYSAVLNESGFNISSDAPMSDYYFNNAELKQMESIQKSSFQNEVSSDLLARIVEELRTRMGLAAQELVPFCNDIRGKSYRELLDTGFSALKNCYETSSNDYCGFNDNWISEFFPSLANVYPDAKFIGILRDPRGAVASIEELRKKNPELAPSVYSFLRSWRKHAAFVHHCRGNSILSNRFYVVRYEDVASDPTGEVSKVCDFLGIPFTDSMLDTDKFRPIDGKKWGKYSHHSDIPKSGIYTNSIERWRETLSQGAIDLIEHVCAPEMSLFNYSFKASPCELSSDGRNFFFDNEDSATGWMRESARDTRNELELEANRYNILNGGDTTDEDIRKSFLFVDLFNEVKKSGLCNRL